MASETVCCLCGYVFYSDQDLEVHIKAEHLEIFRIPPAVPQSEDRKVTQYHPNNLDDESSRQNGTQERKADTRQKEQAITISIKKKVFDDEEDAVQPKIEQMTTRVQCDFCPKSFATVDILKTHVEVIHPDECKFACSHCDRRFLKEGQRTAHGNRVHRLYERNCDECGQIFGHLDDLTRHIEKKHSESQKFNCDKCEKNFVSVEKLVNHQTYFHKPKLVECDFCEKSYTNKRCLRRHVSLREQSRFNPNSKLECFTF